MLDHIKGRAKLLAIAHNDYREDLVSIDQGLIAQLSPPEEGLTPMSTGLKDTQIAKDLRDVIRHLLILNSMNFRFWDVDEEGAFSRYTYKGMTGAMGMRKAFIEAWGTGATAYDFWSKYRAEGIKGIFGDIPDAKRRDSILNELMTSRAVNGVVDFINDQALLNRSFDIPLAEYVSAMLPQSYGDPYLKKIQLTLAEIAAHCDQDRGFYVSTDLTLFADYQLPRVMRAMGVLNYCEDLALKVDHQQLIAEGSAEELAIRSATVLAGEMLAKAFDCTIPALDNFLWQNRNSAGSAPFHLTPTTAY